MQKLHSFPNYANFFGPLITIRSHGPMPGESFAIIQRIQSKLFIHPTHSAIKIKSSSSLPAFRDKAGVTFFSHLLYIYIYIYIYIFKWHSLSQFKSKKTVQQTNQFLRLYIKIKNKKF